MASQREIIVVDNAPDLSARGAELFLRTAKKGVDKKGRFAVALSGGSTPRGMHRLLGEKPFVSDTPWNKTHIFWVDERCVPEEDPASNYGLAKKDFLGRVPISPEHIHPMPGEVPPDQGALLYGKELQSFFGMNEEANPVFDLIFLGMGKDGHTASLFPGRESVLDSGKWVVAIKGGDPDVYRLTLTYDVLNRGKQTCFLVSGKEKAPTVKAVFEESKGQLPAQRIQPTQGKLTWLLDKEAASLLSKETIRGAS